MATKLENHLMFNRRYIDSNGCLSIVIFVFEGVVPCLFFWMVQGLNSYTSGRFEGLRSSIGALEI